MLKLGSLIDWCLSYGTIIATAVIRRSLLVNSSMWISISARQRCDHSGEGRCGAAH